MPKDIVKYKIGRIVIELKENINKQSFSRWRGKRRQWRDLVSPAKETVRAVDPWRGWNGSDRRAGVCSFELVFKLIAREPTYRNSYILT